MPSPEATSSSSSTARSLMRRALQVLCAAAAGLTGCSTGPGPGTGPTPAVPSAPDRPGPPASSVPSIPIAPGRNSTASTPRAYRVDAATHIYQQNAERIYKGKLPPLLYSIGVLNINLDRQGRITSLDWLRPPRIAQVRAEIERTVRAAAPFPIPEKLGRVTYTDTWLFDESGRFQLDTLTEGQRGGS